MRHRTARPFTVEVKGRKRELSQLQSTFTDKSSTSDAQVSSLLLSTFRDGDRSGAVDPVGLAHGTAEPGSQGFNIATSALKVQSKAAATERQAKRILPDLSWEEPVEALLRERAEERALLRRQPRGPRKKNAEPLAAQTRAATPIVEKQLTGREQLPEQRSAVADRQIDVSGRDEHDVAAMKPARPVMSRARVANLRLSRAAPSRVHRHGLEWLYRKWAHRAACRRVRRRGLPVRLRHGERWTRHLPQVC
jgi:hypothetical protein